MRRVKEGGEDVLVLAPEQVLARVWQGRLSAEEGVTAILEQLRFPCEEERERHRKEILRVLVEAKKLGKELRAQEERTRAIGGLVDDLKEALRDVH